MIRPTRQLSDMGDKVTKEETRIVLALLELP